MSEILPFTGTIFFAADVPSAGAPILALSDRTAVPLADLETQDGARVTVSYLPFDRIAFRVIDASGTERWRGISPPLCRKLPGRFAVSISWSESDCELWIEDREVWSSRRGAVVDSVAIGRGPRTDHSQSWSQGSDAARRDRALVARQLVKDGSFERLEAMFLDHLACLRDAAAAVRSGAEYRLQDLATHLRVLLAKGKGGRLLFNMAGAVDAPLLVFDRLSAPESPKLPSERPDLPGFSLHAPPRADWTAEATTKVDLDIWLGLKMGDGFDGARPITNELILKAYADTEAVHSDKRERPLVRVMKRARRMTIGEPATALRQWFLGLADVVVTLAEREVLPRLRDGQSRASLRC